MSQVDAHARPALFERYRPRLFGIAYRMLGSVEDAEDLVQECYLRWHEADPEVVQNPEAWLVSVITRLSIDRLRRASTERAAYEGHWLPEPLPTAYTASPDRRAELASDLSMAFLVLLERLAPEERAAFLLRDVFDVSYAEIARVLERSEPGTRQLVHRARGRVRRDPARFQAPPDVEERLVERFLSALAADDHEAVLALLAPDVTFTADGGGKVPSIRKVVRGAERVARLLLGYERKGKGLVTHRVERINGAPALGTYVGPQLYCTTSLATDGDRIFAFYRTLNPAKLRRVRGASDVR